MITLIVPDHRTTSGTSTRKFNLPSEALAYINNHRVLEVHVFSGGFCFTYTPTKFKAIHKKFTICS